MMDDIKAAADELLRGPQGAALRSLADSDEAKRLGQLLPGDEAEAALRSGDTEQMRRLFEKLLSTGEGRALAEKFAGLGGKP